MACGGAGEEMGAIGGVSGSASGSTRYKLCVQGGVPTLQEATEEGEGEGEVPAGGGGEGAGGEREGGRGNASAVLPVSSAGGGSASGFPRLGEGVGDRATGIAAATATTQTSTGELGAGYPVVGGGAFPSGSNPHGDVFVGMEVAEEGGAAASTSEAAAMGMVATDFGPPMSEAEAASIAGGDAFFGFGSDMRVSI